MYKMFYYIRNILPFFLRFFIFILIYTPLLLKLKKHLVHLEHLVLPFSLNGSSCQTSVQDVKDVTPKSLKIGYFTPVSFQTIYLYITSYIFPIFSVLKITLAPGLPLTRQSCSPIHKKIHKKISCGLVAKSITTPTRYFPSVPLVVCLLV